MSKDLKWNTYLDFYESLLTLKQRDVMDLYYREDFSLSEIAEHSSISRSAVSDLLKRVSKILEEYESNLALVAKFEKRNALYDQLLTQSNQEAISIIQQLQEIE